MKGVRIWKKVTHLYTHTHTYYIHMYSTCLDIIKHVEGNLRVSKSIIQGQCESPIWKVCIHIVYICLYTPFIEDFSGENLNLNSLLHFPFSLYPCFLFMQLVCMNNCSSYPIISPVLSHLPSEPVAPASEKPLASNSVRLVLLRPPVV